MNQQVISSFRSSTTMVLQSQILYALVEWEASRGFDIILTRSLGVLWTVMVMTLVTVQVRQLGMLGGLGLVVLLYRKGNRPSAK